MKRKLGFGVFLLSFLLALVSSAKAEIIYGLTASNDLISFDSTSPFALLSQVQISQAGIVDIDFSPANGRLYGTTNTGSLFTIDLNTGAATLAVTPLSSLGTVTDFDFNPAADRVRIFSTGDQNFRMVPDTSAQTPPTPIGTPGTVTSDGTFSNAAMELVGSAYTNNVNNAGTTTLYSIDTTNNALVIHSGGPQFSTVTQVGLGFGPSLGSNVGFDISQSGIAYLTNDSQLYSVDLAAGSLTDLGGIGYLGLVTSIATPTAVPEPASVALLAVVGGGLSWRRWRKKRQS